MTKRRFVLIDANSIIHRAYHAYPSQLRTSKGVQVNAVYGFSVLLLKVVEELKPDYLVCAFDVPGPTFRHKKYKKYKATRKAMDKELREQFPLVKEVLFAFDVPVLEVPGYEADDVIGTLEDDKRMKDFEKVIVTGDQDMFQLVDTDTKIFLSARNFRDSKIVGRRQVIEKIGLKPEQVIDFKSIYGDPSDNIPGIKGIGKKGAIDLLERYKSLENIYKNLDEVENRYKNKLVKQKKKAFLSYDLATITREAPLKYNVEECKWGDFDMDKVKNVFQELEFRSLLNRLSKSAKEDTSKIAEKRDRSRNGGIVSIRNGEEMEEVISFIKNLDLVCIHISVSDFCLEKSVPEAILVGQDGKYYEISGRAIRSKKGFTSSGKELARLLESEKLLKLGYELKKTAHLLDNLGIRIAGIHFDVKIAAHLFQSGAGSTKLQDLIFNYLGEVYDTQLSLEGSENSKNIGAKEIDAIWRLYKILSKKIGQKTKSAKWNRTRLFYDIEMPLINILAGMERKGILLDKKYLEKYARSLDRKISEIEDEAYGLVGHEFNIASPKQVGEVLFDELKLPKSKRTKTGSYATGESILRELKSAHPVVEKILDYRELAKLRSTYTKTLLQAVCDRTKRIHTTFHQTVTSTGRLSSSDPNLQNIPISSEIGRRVRRAFIVPKGSSFMSFDYSQQELRILAHLSGDNSLVKAFKDDLDIHSVTASKLFAKKIEEVSRKERKIGKTINFGVLYGMSPHGLSEALKITFEKASNFIDRYFKEYEGVKKYFDSYIQDAREKGIAHTIFGRSRLSQDLNSTNVFAKRAAVREIMNFPIQGAAADMMKLAMVEIGELIKSSYDGVAQIVLQIHDELIFEYMGRKGIRSFRNKIKKIMETIYPLKVPLRVDVYEGRNLKAVH